MKKQRRFFLLAIITALLVPSCPMPPNRIKISGPVNGTISLGAKPYDTGDLAEDLAWLFAKEDAAFRLIDYQRDGSDTLQRFLFHYDIEEASYKMSSENLGFNLDETKIGLNYGPFDFHNYEIVLPVSSSVNGGTVFLNLPLSKNFKFYNLSGFRRAQVETGYLDFGPDLDLRNAEIVLEADDCPGQRLTVMQGNGASWNRCSLNGVTIYNDSSLKISGEIGVPLGGMSYAGGSYLLDITVTPVISRLSVLVVTGNGFTVSFPVLKFGSKSGDPQNNLAAWLYQIDFGRIGIGLHLSRPVEGLQYIVSLPGLGLADMEQRTGQNGNEDDYVEFVAQDHALIVVDGGNVQQIFEINAKVTAGIPDELVL
ncbi:MAG: hypothetical protein LBH73_05975, partial [Spirochaetaceae bacterium]|nr:hypothetical protein [Spirochaetaceae bacterium]